MKTSVCGVRGERCLGINIVAGVKTCSVGEGNKEIEETKFTVLAEVNASHDWMSIKVE